MGQSEHDKIIQAFTSLGVAFNETQHAEVRTSQEAADIRGSRLSEGVKALFVRFTRTNSPGRKWFAVIDLPADKLLDWKKAKAILQANDVGFATPEEVVEHTGCEPGGVPPLGHKNSLAILADPLIFNEGNSEFNAGLKTVSIHMKSSDLKKALDSAGAAYFSLVKN